MLKSKVSFLVFLKAQASAFIGGAVDFAVMVIATEIFHIHYTVSILISGFIGAIVNFAINRKWTYRAEGEKVKGQLLKFIVVVIGSVLLKSGGTYLFTNWLNIDYKISRILTDLLVSIGFNYTLQTYWVFKKGKHLKES